MSAKNYYIRDDNPEVLKTLAEEYQSMGRDTKIEGNRLTVFALKQKPPLVSKKKKKFERKPKPAAAAPKPKKE